jgi:hypothetical protein
MKRILTLLALFALSMAMPAAFAQMAPSVDLGADPAKAIAGRDLPANDARVEQARAWLKKVTETTGENEEQAAASAMKLARFFMDSIRVRALPAEVLEGMAAQAVPGKSLSDLTAGYFNARRNTADKTHAAAMAALTGRK